MNGFTKVERDLLMLVLSDINIQWKANKKSKIANVALPLTNLFNLHIDDVYNTLLDFLTGVVTEEVVVNEIEQLIFG